VSFSRRSHFETASADSSEATDTVDLTESNPTRCGLSEPVALPAVALYQPHPLGLPQARSAVAAWYPRGAGAEQVVLCASTSEAYGWLMKLLCDAGDEVLVAHPGYPLFEHLGALESVTVKGFPLRFDGEWVIDLPRLVEASSARTRALVLVSPNNPTGAYLREDEFVAVQRLCAERGWALVVDEVFAEPSRSFVTRPAQALTFCLGGLSKAAGLPQLKLAWMVVGGPATMRDEALRRLDFIADSYLSVSSAVQEALPSLLGGSGEFRARVGKRCLENRRFLAELREPGAAWQLLPAQAGWVAVLRVPEHPSEQERVATLAARGVRVHPGYFYDFPVGSHLVVSLLPELELFRTGARRLVAALN
jgi:alanine-synthesizing transaminase